LYIPNHFPASIKISRTGNLSAAVAVLMKKLENRINDKKEEKKD
jgi:hypothetical protein